MMTAIEDSGHDGQERGFAAPAGGAMEDVDHAQRFGEVGDQLLGLRIGIVTVGHFAREASAVFLQVGAGLGQTDGDHLMLEFRERGAHVSQESAPRPRGQVGLMDQPQFDARVVQFVKQ